MCSVEGLVAVFNVAGFGVSISDACMEAGSAASDAAVGHCLTKNFAIQVANPAANTQTTVRIVSQVAQTTAMTLVPSDMVPDVA